MIRVILLSCGLLLALPTTTVHAAFWECQECRSHCGVGAQGDACMSTCQCDDGSMASSHSALGSLLDSTAQLAQHKSAFNARIATARSRYFSGGLDVKSRAQAEKAFLALLYDKDLALAFPLITAGFSETARLGVELADAMSGGALDNGIPKDASPDFQRWIAAVRRTLGARNNRDMLVLNDSAKFQRALDANAAAYSVYKARRDSAERDLFEKEQHRLSELEKAKENVAADGGVRLGKSTVRTLMTYDQGTGNMSVELDQAVMTLSHGGPQVIECKYGPGQGPSGDPIYYTFVYWYERAPAYISEVLNADKNRVFHFLGASARTDCPASNLAAHAARLAIMETHPWHEAVVAPSTAAEILEASKEQRAQKSLTREQETLDRQCVAYADRLRKTGEKAATSVGAARSYEKMQVTYAEKCGADR